MDQRMLQEKVLSDPSAIAALEQELLSAEESESQLGEFLSYVEETEAGMKAVLMSVPVPSHLKRKLLALPEVDETQSAEPNPNDRHGLPFSTKQVVILAKRFRVALIMALVFATAAVFSLFMPGA